MKRKLSKFKLIVLTVLVLGLAATGYTVYKLDSWNSFIWLSDYEFNSPSFEEGDGVTDIIFLVVDHWEPGGREDLLNAWMQDYRELALRHRDYHGNPLQHSWFYPIDQFRGYEVDSVALLCAQGLGDIELHWHHINDNSETFRAKLTVGLDSLRAHHALITEDGSEQFAFIHGNWALDNSRFDRGDHFCGVNDEITILQEYGCYADFTFPSMSHTSQPSLVNKIYYCVDDPEKPKSYDEGVRSSVGFEPSPEHFMIFEGPTVIDWADWRFGTHPTFEDGNLYWEIPSSLHRFEVWLKANVCVEGRPNWVFVRPFTHGCSLRNQDAIDNIIGKNFDEMLTAMEANFNDGTKYRLHYMTAREAYNVVKAAEAGHNGDPNDYRDFALPRYVYPSPEAQAVIH